MNRILVIILTGSFMLAGITSLTLAEMMGVIENVSFFSALDDGIVRASGIGF